MGSNRLVWGEGPVPCKGMIIGEAPGAQEEREGRPFVGPSGKLLNEALAAGGLAREEVYITNAFKLRPENNRNPTEDELADHLHHLALEFDNVRPKYVLSLGKVSSEWLLNRPVAIMKERGTWVNPNHLVTFHPAYVLRNPAAREDFFHDIADFAEQVIRKE